MSIENVFADLASLVGAGRLVEPEMNAAKGARIINVLCMMLFQVRTASGSCALPREASDRIRQ